MKLSSILPTCMVAFAATAAAAPTDAALSSLALVNTTIASPSLLNATLSDGLNPTPAWCERVTGPIGLTWIFNVYIRDVDKEDWDPLCARLWKELKGFEFLCMVSNPYCGPAGGPNEGFDDILRWKFQAGLGCNKGCVDAAYWGATKNKYGKLDLREC